MISVYINIIHKTHPTEKQNTSVNIDKYIRTYFRLLLYISRSRYISMTIICYKRRRNFCAIGSDNIESSINESLIILVIR